jgi:hypothetical protein
MPLWQDVYRHRDAVADVGSAADRLTDLADQLKSVELLVEAVRLADAYERLANPRKRQSRAKSSEQCLGEPKRTQERQGEKRKFASSGPQSVSTDDDGIDYVS